MARFKYGWTEEKIERFIKDGRGTGRGKDYTPWLTTQDVPSRGRSHRVALPKTGRQHHFLSDNEFYAFLDMALDADVTDIREQYPLDRKETIAIAAAKKIKHPAYKGTPIVMTTDFVETRMGPHGYSERAISIKPDEELKEGRTIEKLEIERSYWSRRGVPWFIRLASDLKTTRSLNLEWIFDNTLEGDADPIDEENVLQQLPAGLDLHHDQPIREMCTWLDSRLQFEPGRALQITRRLLGSRRVIVDLTKPMLSEQPCKNFTIRAGLS